MDDAPLFGIVFLIGLIAGFSLCNLAYSEEREVTGTVKSIISECEKELPRNIKCKIIAVTDNKQGKGK